MKSRNGKIARLPKKIRDQLNRRLQNGQRGPEILAKYPCQLSDDALRRGAVFNYPTQTETNQNKAIEPNSPAPTHTETK